MKWIETDVRRISKAYELRFVLEALREAKKLHKGMWRADEREAFTHPFKVCQILMFYMLLYGILDKAKSSAALLRDIDIILAAALLHDVLEDVRKNPAMMRRIRLWLKFSDKKVTTKDDNISIIMKYLSLKFTEEIVSLVFALTKHDKVGIMEYCQNIGNKLGAVLIKLADRLHNLRNMIRRLGSNKFFTEERLREQANETNECILKLSYWVSMYEEKFPTENRVGYLAVVGGMTSELKKTVHLAEVALAELTV